MLKAIDAGICERLRDEFALLGATKSDGSYNFMTVSWGGFGILWGKEVCFVFVRPERYTYEFCEASECFSLSFFGKDRMKDLVFCGRNSGKDVDKTRECGFKVEIIDGVPRFDDATLTLTLKKLYAQDIEKACFIDTSLLKNYENAGFHRMYICEVTNSECGIRNAE